MRRMGDSGGGGRGYTVCVWEGCLLYGTCTAPKEHECIELYGIDFSLSFFWGKYYIFAVSKHLERPLSDADILSQRQLAILLLLSFLPGKTE